MVAALLFVVPSFLLVKYFWFCARQESFSLLVCVPWPNLGHESNEAAPRPPLFFREREKDLKLQHSNHRIMYLQVLNLNFSTFRYSDTSTPVLNLVPARVNLRTDYITKFRY